MIVEADGQWHSEDNKFGSAEWKATHPIAPPAKPASPAKRASSPVKPVANGVNGKDKPRPSNDEIVILDSDEEEEDEGRVKRELSPSTDGALARGSMSVGGSQPSRSQVTDIIDLTLDSDDEDLPPPPPRSHVPPTKKRKETEDLPSPTEQIWKKSRTDTPSSSQSTLNALVNNGTLRMAEEASASRRLPPPVISPSQSRYSSSQPAQYRGNGSQPYGSSPGLPPPPSSLPRRPSTSAHDNFRNNTLPPLSPYASQRGSGAGASSPRNWR